MEHVLVVPAEHVEKLFTSSNFYNSKDNDKVLESFLNHSFFVNRDNAENDPAYKQLIPYCLLFKNDKLLCYKRGKKGNEVRLHAKWSVGCGGHINPMPSMTNKQIYDLNLLREMREEVGLTLNKFWGEDVGFIYDSSNNVGKVHLGVLHQIHLFNEDTKLTMEDTITEHQFLHPSEIDSVLGIANFESWSQIALKHLEY
jgi:predicted NUDIX family phosphoesterase